MQSSSQWKGKGDTVVWFTPFQMWTETLKLRVHANYLILGGINCGQNFLLKWGKVVIIMVLSTARWQQYTFVGKVEDNLLKEFLDDSGKWTAVWDKLYLDTSQDDQSHLPWRWNSMSSKGPKFCWLVRRTSKAVGTTKESVHWKYLWTF